ncbi:MAG: flagellar motor switch protein FliG [Fusobacteriota bacterium]
MAKKNDTLTGKQKSAILLISLGQDIASEVFKHLEEDQIEQLTLEIARLHKIDSETKDKVFEEFNELMVAQQYISQGGISYAKDILEKAMGEDRALSVIKKLTSSLQVKPFDFIQRTESRQILNFISGEHPQTIALIISYLSAEKAAQIISEIPEDKQSEIAKRIALMDRTSPEMIREVERVLERKISSIAGEDYTSTGGLESVVDILNNVDRGTEKTILESLEDQEPELAEEIKKQMFVFEDITLLDDPGIQLVLRKVENKDLSLALKGSSEEVKEKILANMSKNASERLRDDMEYMGPVRVKDVEEAQQKIVNSIRKLEDQGEIVIARGNEDEMIV